MADVPGRYTAGTRSAARVLRERVEAQRDPFADDVLERLIASNHNYQREHGHYIVPLAERLLSLRKGVGALVATTRCYKRPDSKLESDPGPCGKCAACMARIAYYGAA